MSEYREFETERLYIRPASEEDAEFYFELLNSPKWLQFIGDRKVKTVEDARQYILKKMQPQLERLGYSNNTVIRKEDNVKMGACGLYDREGLEGIDIGFAFLPEYEKQGYGYEAALEIKNAAFNVFGIKLISAITSKKNHASQKLLKKIGLVKTGTTKLTNEDEELLVYRLERGIQL